jgi:hypothetical protein
MSSTSECKCCGAEEGNCQCKFKSGAPQQEQKAQSQGSQQSCQCCGKQQGTCTCAMKQQSPMSTCNCCATALGLCTCTSPIGALSCACPACSISASRSIATFSPHPAQMFMQPSMLNLACRCPVAGPLIQSYYGTAPYTQFTQFFGGTTPFAGGMRYHPGVLCSPGSCRMGGADNAFRDVWGLNRKMMGREKMWQDFSACGML